MSGQDLLSVVLDGNPTKRIPITVEWDVNPAIEATPSFVSWNDVSANIKPMNASLRHLDNKAFKILSLRTTCSVFQISGSSDQTKSIQELRICLSPDTPPGSYLNEYAILELDNPQQPVLSIRLSALIKKVADQP